MRFDQFLFENVIDGTDKFKSKMSSDFKSKIQAAVDSIPGAFAKQAELEEHVRKELDRIKAAPDKALKKYALELGHMRSQYKKDAPILELIWFGSEPDDEFHDVVKLFMQKHGKEVLAVAEKAVKDLEDLRTWSLHQKWPAGQASLFRDTRYGYAHHQMTSSILPAIKKLIR